MQLTHDGGRRNWAPAALAVGAIGAGLVIARLPLAELILVLGAAAVLVATLAEPLLGIGAALIVGPARAWLEIARPGIAPHIGQLVLLLALAAWLASKLLQRDFSVPLPPLLWSLVAFLLAGLVSLWDAVDIWAGTLEFAKWLQVLLVALVVLDALSSRSSEDSQDRRVWLTVGLLAASALAQAGIGIWQFALRGQGVENFAIDDRFYRAYGTFQQPNPFAGLLGIVGAVLVGIAMASAADALRARDGRRALAIGAVAGGPALVVLAGLIASWSRGGWMAFVAAMATVVVLLPRRSRWGLALVLVAAVLAVGLYSAGLMPAAIAGRLTSFFSYVRFEDVRGMGVTDTNYSVVERMAHWQAALGMWRARFWRGVGLGCYEAAYADYRLILWPLPLGHAHNFYLNLLAEVGLPGLLVYLAWLGAQFIGLAVASRRLAGWERGLAIGLAAAWTQLAVHSLVDNLLVNNVHLHVGVLVALTAWTWSQASHASRRL